MSININLLPWREARREKQTRAFYGVVLLMLLTGGALAYAVSYVYQQQLVAQQQRNAYITTYIERLNREIADVKRYQSDAEQLGEQLRLFQTLHGERIHTVQLFNDLAASVAQGVVYQRLSRSGERISLSAVAGNERQVSEQLRQIASMPGLGVPVLSEVASGQNGSERAFQFEVIQSADTAAAEEAGP
ncbi:PilN domain-containing protein [Halomonas sp. GFAJ-1]|uniref:PilN domain-containing protein n=1 Tax=Halomonas sp. GFAJ-1 TaxID=1118153 RepID=UPI00023A54B2|nr:PilN domain-containing protein [Halomonas sp. GFAJ-1]AVI61263.1 fimbrial assembly protein [Halomonas sp. GFAJ-1]EHK61931.1 fimbrial assembly [Halomonas sp. GFAJ-1]